MTVLHSYQSLEILRPGQAGEDGSDTLLIFEEFQEL